MLANTHRRHLVSNRLALATGIILLLAQTNQQNPWQLQDGEATQVNVTTTETGTDSSKSYYSVLLDLGLLLFAR